MKRHIIFLASLVFAAFGLQSCLDYDNPGDELGANEVNSGERYSGESDKINYRKCVSTPEQFDLYTEKLATVLGQSVTGQYIMRGGKEGDPPGDHAYQRQYNLGPDNYVQYFVATHKDFMYGTLTSTYNNSKEFNGGEHWAYTEAKNQFVPLLNHPYADSIPEVKAINLLYLSLIAQENADLSGPFTYFEDKQNLENPATYVPLPDIYYNIKQNLDTIVAALKYYDENRPDWYKQKMQTLMGMYMKTTQDQSYGPSGMRSFIRLANSLKLRMAMNIVKIQPDSAKIWAEEAVAGGVIEEEVDQQGMFPSIYGGAHPLCNISEGWGDTRLSASFESILMSLNHPYATHLFKKNGADLTNKKTGEVTPKDSKLVGIRAGLLMTDGQSAPPNYRVAYSRIDRDVMFFSPIYYIKLAEVEFLRAEGALRGWNMGGTAQHFYESGIRHANFEDPMFAQMNPWYNNEVEQYMQLEQAIDYVQQDPLGDGRYNGSGEEGAGWPSVTKIGVKWNDGDSQETKLEKIITQKYIAVFPNSWIAWTDLRRTGYPKLFPVLNTNDGDGSIKQGDMIRRIPWQATEPQEIANIEATGLNCLGGPDVQATRLWWDVDAPNF